MQKVEEATIRSMLRSDEEKEAFEEVLYVRAKAKTADAAGAYHTTMIKDGTMADNAVTTGVIECELDTGAEKSSMNDGRHSLPYRRRAYAPFVQHGEWYSYAAQVEGSTARYLQRQDHGWYGNEFTHVTPCVRGQICS